MRLTSLVALSVLLVLAGNALMGAGGAPRSGLGATLSSEQPPTIASSTEFLFVSSYTSGTITRFNLTDLSSTVIISGLTQPEYGACSPDGRIYIPEGTSGLIERFAQDGTGRTAILSSSPLHPEGLSFNARGDLFFNTRDASDGAAWMIAGGTPGGTPVRATAVFTSFGEGTAFAANGDLLGIDAPNGIAYRFSPPFSASNAGRIFASGPRNWADVAVAANGDVYVAHGNQFPTEGTGTILRFAADGTPMGAFATGFRNPEALEFDSAGNLYATDFATFAGFPDDRIFKITPAGTTTLIGSFPGALGLTLCRNGASNPPPQIPEVSANWKPLLAGVFALVLTGVGAWTSRARPWGGPTGRNADLQAFAITALPFVLAEVFTGALSVLTGTLTLPPWLGMGMIVDVAIFIVGILLAAGRLIKRPVVVAAAPQDRREG